jgi:hypothetical protein
MILWTLVFFGAGFLFWRGGLVAAFLLVVLEGALRKWAFPEYQNFLYWSKDLVLAGVYARYFGAKVLNQNQLIPSHRVNALLGMLALYGAAEMLNPELPSWLVGALGFKAYVFYVPLFYILRDSVATAGAVLRFIALYVLLSVPVSTLGVVQFFSPLDSPLVSYLQWEETAQAPAPALVGSFPRVSGTFSYISGFATYLFVIVMVAIALLNLGRLGTAARVLVAGALVLGVTTLIMTGSRGAVALLLLQLPVFLLLVGKRRLALRTGVVVVALAVLVPWLAPDAVGAFWQRTTAVDDEQERLTTLITQPLLFLGPSLPWGFGVGSTHQAARFLTDVEPYSWLPTDDFEDEPGRVMLELGPLGFLLYYGIRVLLLVDTLGLVRRLADSDLRVLAASSLLVQACFLAMPIVFNATAGFFVWSLSGLLLLLPRLDGARRLGTT